MGCFGSKHERLDVDLEGAPMWAQLSDKGIQQACMPHQMGYVPDAGFMQHQAANGSPWSEYVTTGPLYIDPSTGSLAGPWAECICWAVQYELQDEWQSLPEYSDGEGPVASVLAALAVASYDRKDAPRLASAAVELEFAARHAARMGTSMPVVGGDAATSHIGWAFGDPVFSALPQPVAPQVPAPQMAIAYQPQGYMQQPVLCGTMPAIQASPVAYGQGFYGQPAAPTYTQPALMYGTCPGGFAPNPRPQQDQSAQQQFFQPTLLGQRPPSSGGKPTDGKPLALPEAEKPGAEDNMGKILSAVKEEVDVDLEAAQTKVEDL
mmetsp:Transcript_89579/g.196289  ORF Transcript_89579/g.196289 Transcript_89579/m.196289 type:complete len:321 (+) Transcript_89579:145-1107(+)